MVASRLIKQGESVIAEDPLLFVKNDENKIESLNLQFQNLSSDNQKKISSLCDSNSSGDPDKKIVRIFHSNCIQVTLEHGAALYPTISRINHSCSPNVVWSWKRGNAKRKEVRALKSILEGEEICSNYIDDVETNYNTAEVRKASLSKWNFCCTCAVCSLPEEELQKNDHLRSHIGTQHFLIPSLVSSQDLLGCLSAAQKKMSALLKLEDQLMADLPAAYMEIFEFMAIAKAMKYDVIEDPDVNRKKAEDLANMFGDKFVNEYQVKLNDILYGQ